MTNSLRAGAGACTGRKSGKGVFIPWKDLRERLMAIGSADEFVRLRYSDHPEDYFRAAQEPAPTEVWMGVIERYPDARFWVAQNKIAPIEVLAVLAKDPDPKVRCMVVMKRKLTPELLEALAHDSDESVRERAARHKRTPRAVLEDLADDPWEEIRSVVTEAVRAEVSRS
jgi:hypothetical protein